MSFNVTSVEIHSNSLLFPLTGSINLAAPLAVMRIPAGFCRPLHACLPPIQAETCAARCHRLDALHPLAAAPHPQAAFPEPHSPITAVCCCLCSIMGFNLAEKTPLE